MATLYSLSSLERILKSDIAYLKTISAETEKNRPVFFRNLQNKILNEGVSYTVEAMSMLIVKEEYFPKAKAFVMKKIEESVPIMRKELLEKKDLDGYMGYLASAFTDAVIYIRKLNAEGETDKCIS